MHDQLDFPLLFKIDTSKPRLTSSPRSRELLRFLLESTSPTLPVIVP